MCLKRLNAFPPYYQAALGDSRSHCLSSRRPVGVLVGVRSIKFIQGMNGKFDKSNKSDPTFNQGAFIFQTDGGRCGEVPREATVERDGE